MASTNYLKIEQDFNTPKYLKCLAEGMIEWIEVKSQTGNQEINFYKTELEKEIKPSEKLPTKVINKMKALGINGDTLKEFKGVFNEKIKP